MHLLNLARSQARGKPEEAAGEVRALLDGMRENETAVKTSTDAFESTLNLASSYLKVLDPEVGEEELIEAVAVELAKVRRMAELSELH